MLQESDRTKDQLDTAVSAKNGREAERLAELDYLGAVQTGADRVLQEIVDEVRSIFGTDLCMVNLILSDVQYFRAWSGELPSDLVKARQDPRERSMCQYVVETEVPFVVHDFLSTGKFRDQHFCVNYGIRFYAGTPLITSGGHAIGTLCLLNARPMQFGEEQMRVLSAFARAVTGRLELLGALEREQAAKEEEVRRSQKLQRTLDSLSAHMAIVDESGIIIAVNKAWRQFGQSNGAVGRNFSEGANYLRVCESATGPWSEEAAPFAEGIRSVLKGQLEKFTLEYPCHSSSERRWFIGRVTPFLTIGSPQVVVAHEDITERKEAEQRLNAQYAVTRILEESATLDEVFPKILETISESLGWQISKVWHLDRPADVLRCGQTWYAPSVDVAESGEITQQSTFPRGVGLPGRVWASGKPVWISDAVRDPKSIPFNEGLHGAVAFPILLRGEVLGVMGFFSREIRPPDAAVLEMLRTFGTQIGQFVERKQAEKTLRESEAQLNAILDNLTEGVLMADLQGHVIFANPAARTMLGVSPEEPLEELPDPWEDFHLPEAVAHCAQNREGIEARVRYKETFLRIKLECLAEHENDQGDVLVVVQDLSEGRRLEASQQRFLANAAHQLSTPTMAILGAAELLATGDDADPTIRRRLLNHIFSEGHRMQQLSETLLRLSRVGWDQREPSLEILDLSRAGQQAIERMAPLIENMGLRALVEGESTTTTCVRGDPQWLQEVLLTLLSNAIKHSSRGADIRLRVSAGTITVEDEGAGISPDDLPHIFERFYRGKGSSEGFGLGLPICRELIERMGGSISISSREGVGTAVEIQLPEG